MKRKEAQKREKYFIW